MSEWLPIETAPKDGTKVLLYASERCPNCPPEGNGITTAWFDGDEWVDGRLNTGEYISLAHQPTHWQPLPSPPK